MKLGNNETLDLSGGNYSLKISGALDIEWQVEDEGFSALEGGSFAGVASRSALISKCTIKVVNAGANTLTVSRVRPD